MIRQIYSEVKKDDETTLQNMVLVRIFSIADTGARPIFQATIMERFVLADGETIIESKEIMPEATEGFYLREGISQFDELVAAHLVLNKDEEE